MADGRLRVLPLIKGLGVGGAERLVVDQLTHSDRDRFDYHVAYLLPWKDLVVPDIEAIGVPVTCLDAPSVLRPTWLRRLRTLLDDVDPDIVHIHSPALAALARPLVRATRAETALVYTEHNRWGQYRLPTRLLNRATYGLDDATIAVSEGVLATIDHRARRTAEVIMHGVDVDAVRAQADRAGVREELGVSDSTIVVVTVANLRSSKDYPNILHAASRVLAERDDVLFLSVGQGPDEAEILALHERLGLGDGYRFLGFRRDAVRVVSGSDVFLLGSRHEGLPLALMEAMALGLPVVATTVGGIPEVVDDGVHGYLVPSETSVQLADAVLRMAGDGAARARMASAARERGDALDSGPAITRIEEMYAAISTRTARASC